MKSDKQTAFRFRYRYRLSGAGKRHSFTIKNNSFVNQIIVLTHKNIRPSAITFLHGINILPGYIALLNFFQRAPVLFSHQATRRFVFPLSKPFCLWADLPSQLIKSLAPSAWHKEIPERILPRGLRCNAIGAGY